MISIIPLFWKPAVEIVLLWFVIYHIIRFLEGTRAKPVFVGIVIILVVFLLAQKLGLQELDWLLTKLFGISVIAILIIFHPEIRQGLARLGQRHLFKVALREEEIDTILKEVIRAVERLTSQKIGAIIAIEKNDTLNEFAQSGVAIDAEVSSELLEAIFTPNNPLHDGGVVIQQGRITAAGCLFPLSHNQALSRIYGTRHRAAMGLSEESDAIVIIVSEERQDVVLVYRERLFRDLGREEMLEKIKECLNRKEDE